MIDPKRTGRPVGFRLPLLVGLGLALSCLPAGAEEPADELLRLLPDDVGFGVVIRDLRGHGERISASPFAALLRGTEPGKALVDSPEVRKLQDFDRILKAHLKTDLQQVRDDVLGDAIVFAYWPGTPTDATAERGVFLARARDPGLLARLAEAINRIQKESGDLVNLEARKHEGVSYHRREEKGGQVSYYLVQGPLLAYSESESAIQQIIAALKQSPRASLRDQLHRLGVQDALAVIWLNPRAFDRHLQHQLDQASDPLFTFLKTFTRYWKEFEGAALAVRIRQEIDVSLCVRVRLAGLPPPARRLLAKLGQPSVLWGYFPDRVIFAVAGRVDLAALAETVAEFVPENSRRKLRGSLAQTTTALLGRDFEKDVLPNLGPDWGYYVAAPPAAEPWFPHAVLAVSVQSRGDKPLDQALFDVLRVWVGFGVLAADKGIVQIRNESQGTVAVVSLYSEQLFPTGFQPALAAKASCLVLASSPAALRRFAESVGQPLAQPVAQPVAQPRAASKGEADVEGVLLARLSLREARSYLTERRQPLLDAVSKGQVLSAQEAGKRLDGLLSALELFDGVDLRLRTEPDQANLTLHFRPTKPLR